MKPVIWKTLRVIYLIFILGVIGIALSYGIPLYHYLKKPVGQTTATVMSENTAPDSGTSPDLASASPSQSPWTATVLNADAAALPRFKDAVDKVAADSPKAYTGLGVLYQMKGLKKEALPLYEKALELDPTFVDARYRMGTVYHELGRFDDAVWQYQEALKVKPDHLESLFGMGAALQQKERFREAESAYLKILGLKPGEFQALNNLGIVYENLGLYGKALSAFEAAHLAKPNDAVVRENWEGAKRLYPNERPIALDIPKIEAPIAPTPQPAKKLFSASSKKTHRVTLKNGHALSGALGEETPKGFWLEVEDGASVFVNRSEVLTLEEEK